MPDYAVFEVTSEFCKLWLPAIHKENFQITKNSVVCCEYFDTTEMQRVALQKQGRNLV